jgi:hypothetical protein
MKKSLLLSFALLVACGGGGGGDEGTLRVRASGEEAAVMGYPVTIPGGSIAFEDDYTVTFEHVFVALESLTLGMSDGSRTRLVNSPVIIDLTEGPEVVWDVKVPAQRWDRVSYRTHVPGHDDRIVGDVSFNDIHTMLTANYAIFVQGTATQGGDSFTFSFGFPPIEHSRCENDDGTEGIVVGTNAITEAEVTIHLDHLFFDSLALDEPKLRFEPFAAASVGGDVSNVFLTQSITDIRDRMGNPIMDGPNVVVYDPGPYVLSPTSLEQYLLAAGSTMGHWNGEGHCDYAPIEP